MKNKTKENELIKKIQDLHKEIGRYIFDNNKDDLRIPYLISEGITIQLDIVIKTIIDFEYPFYKDSDILTDLTY